MSGCCCKREVQYAPVIMPRPAAPVYGDCICSLPVLVILILIVLQFSRYGKGCCEGTDTFHDRCFPVGNGILFIIALFFLACVGCPKGVDYGAY
jgi:hypothetical protein